MEYFGLLQITKLLNPEGESFPQLVQDNLKVNHYPDCQQLVIWLPLPVNSYDELICYEGDDKKEIFQMELSHFTFGLTQIIVDTLCIPPGKGIFCIYKGKLVVHEIMYEKEIEVPPISYKDFEPDFPYTYRDGTGKPIPDEDLMLRQQIIEKIEDAFISKLSFHSTGRDGYIMYNDKGKSARFVYEMGGGDCMIFVLLPTDDHWFEDTGFPLEEKKKIVEHLAFMTHRDFTGGAAYTIENNSIVFYRK